MAEKPNNSEIVVAEGKDTLNGSKPLKNARQERYCHEYLIDLVQSYASVRAGYKRLAAKIQGARLMTYPHIQARIAYLQAERLRRLDLDADSVVKELAKIGYSNIEDYLTVDENGDVHLKDFDSIDRDKLAAVESIKVNTTTNKGDSRTYTTTQFKLHNKENALEQLGKHFGIYEKDNLQSKPDARQFTLIEVKALIAEGERLEAEIVGITSGIAGEKLIISDTVTPDKDAKGVTINANQ